MSVIITLYLSNNLEPKNFSIYGSIISISLILSGIFSFSQARFMTEGVKTNDLNGLFINVTSISLIPLVIFSILVSLFGRNYINPNINEYFLLIFFLIISFFFRNCFLNYERIRNNYKNFFYYYSYDKLILLLSLLIFIFTNKFDLFLKLYCISSLIIVITYFYKIKKINLDFLNDINLIKSSNYKFFINILDYLISINILIVIMMNFEKYEFSSSITLGLTLYSLIMIPLAFLETFIGPVIARIFINKNKNLFQNFFNKNLINNLYFLLIFFLIFKFIFINFELVELIFPKYRSFEIIIFSVTYLSFFSFIKLYYYWFFNALNKINIVLIGKFILFLLIFTLFIIYKDNLKLFFYFYILSLLFYSLFVILSFSFFKKNNSNIKVYCMVFVIKLDFTVFYFFDEYINIANFFIMIFLIVFYFFHKPLKKNLHNLKNFKLRNI